MIKAVPIAMDTVETLLKDTPELRTPLYKGHCW